MHTSRSPFPLTARHLIPALGSRRFVRPLVLILAVVAAAGAAACGDPGRVTRPAARSSGSFDVSTKSARGNVHRLVGTGGAVSHYIDGQLFAVRTGDGLTVYRGGRTLSFSIPAGGGVPIWARTSARRAGVSLDAMLEDAGAVEEEKWCVLELLDLIASSAALAAAVDVALGVTVVTSGTGTPAAYAAIVIATANYARSVDKYRRCKDPTAAQDTVSSF
ncbi:MAG: hypothetical protein WKG32_16970 [Gemmatimonadaceae bacterium]